MFTFCIICVCFRTPCKTISLDEIIKYILSSLMCKLTLPGWASGKVFSMRAGHTGIASPFPWLSQESGLKIYTLQATCQVPGLTGLMP